MRVRWILPLLSIGLAASAAGQVVNSDFDDGTQGWSFRLAAAGGGVVDWDSGVGDPAPGSARAGNVFVEPAVDGWKQCVPVSGTDFAFTAAVASALQAGNSCRITIDFIALGDCVNGTPIVLEAVSSNTRNDGGFETISVGGPLPFGVEAAAVFLDHVRAKGALPGDSYCHFDHVQLGADTMFGAHFD
jgi:hypothetical protein